MSHKETSASQGGLGAYLYCIASPKPPPEVFHGLEAPDGSPIRVLGERAAGVLRTVARDRYGRAAAERFAEDLGALALEVRHHEAVADRLMERGFTVLPSRFGVIYSSDEALAGALLDRSEEIDRSLRRLRGREEWSMTLLGDRGALARRLASTAQEVRELDREISSSSEGRAFLLGRKRSVVLGELVDSRFGEVSSDLLGRVQSHAEEILVERPQARKAEPSSLEPILCITCLLRREDRKALLDELEASAPCWLADGYILRTSGPWPAYNFLDLEPSRAPSTHGN
ncbi:MAG: GvpL/GvpF family gas vesicle protein [Planctomycetes bacterium]|nr:GvpL/GvpF family gas vesicle protein [Planctomycetota bacterium]